MHPDPSPYDALLLVSFGGPEKPEDVVPFLENVTRGRGIPRERLEEVGEHYFLLRRPVADQRPEPRAPRRARARTSPATASTCRSTGATATGTRTSPTPCAQMAADGVTPGGLLRHRAYSSYSGCRQYRENLADAVAEVEGAPRLDRLRHYFNHPGFVEPIVDATLAALADLADAARDGAHLVFVTHSIPTSMNDAQRPATAGAYVAQHRSVVAEIVERVRQETGHRYAARPGLLLAVRPAARAVARARRQRPPRGAGPQAAARRSWWCRSASSPTTWRSSTTSTPRRAATAEKLGLCVRPGGDAPASTRASSRWCATCSSSGPRSSAASEVAAARRRQPAGLAGTSARPAAAPNPAGRAARAVRGGLP